MAHLGNFKPQSVGTKILLIEEHEFGNWIAEEIRTADYVITKTGLCLKSRDGTLPPLAIERDGNFYLLEMAKSNAGPENNKIVKPSNPSAKYRSLDDD
jgi:hypothetical protein